MNDSFFQIPIVYVGVLPVSEMAVLWGPVFVALGSGSERLNVDELSWQKLHDTSMVSGCNSLLSKKRSRRYLCRKEKLDHWV